MRFSVTAVTLFTLIASAVAQYPACTTQCLLHPNYDVCAQSNLQCLCTNPVFIANTTACFTASCNATDLATAEKVAQETCAKIGVSLTSTPSATPSSVIKGAVASASPSAKGGASTATYSTLLALSGAAAVLSIWI